MLEKTKEPFTPPSTNLTKFPQGSIRELLSLATPLFLILFAGCVLNFLERIWFAHFSLQALEASVNAIYLLRIFQMPCIALAMMAQAYVGYHNGAKELTNIGRCIWQMIWFSLFSMVITVPLSFFAQDLFFKGLEVEKTAAPYFVILVFCNFLYPLGSALSSFYLGRGKTTFTVLATLGAYLLNAGLDIALIFGIDPWIPAMGLKGAAFATLLSQGVFCLLLFALFVKKSNQETFGTREWKFQPKIFWKYISPGIPRAMGRLLLFAFWAANTHIMAVKGGDYQLILSIGGTIGMFVMFLSDGILQAFVVLISNALGARNYDRFKKFLNSGLLVIFVLGVILIFPLVLFPNSVVSLFSLKTTLTASLKWCLMWMWLHTVVLMLNALLLAVLLSYKDTVFVLIASFIAAVFGYMTTFAGMNYFKLSADKFWFLTFVNMVFCTCLYAWRISRKQWLQPDFKSTDVIT
ncbi:MAG TPA: MATE family efflux transporter [Rhabdochlamydiaceae bacterium]|nr:MATE family efflux transporter [Rhabdochlamydiaceae bacterium]